MGEKQLHLSMPVRLSYEPGNFILHSGVRQLVKDIVSEVTADRFGLALVHANERMGKTHGSIYLADQLLQRGFFPRIVEGQDVERWLRSGEGQKEFSEDQIILIDDADEYLGILAAGQSGEFVRFVESLRVAQSGLVLFLTRELDEMNFDEHVRSRLIPGQGFRILAPQPEELRNIVFTMARQRGIHLTERKIAYIEKRIGRDLASIEEYLEKVKYLADVLGKSVRFPLLSDAM